MKREKITITDEGAIVAPNHPAGIRMTIGEIADLLGIYYPTAKRHIRAIEKAGIADGDYSMTCVSEGTVFTPNFTASKWLRRWRSGCARGKRTLFGGG